MNIILFNDDALIDADNTGDTSRAIRLTGAAAKHCRQVLNVAIGERIKVGQINGLMGHAIITGIDDNCVYANACLDTPPPKAHPTTLVMAMPRPKAFRRILKNITELGIKRIILINAYKVEKSYWQSPLLNADNINSIMIEGLEQAKDTLLPIIDIQQRFKPFAEDTLPNLCQDKHSFVAHPYTLEADDSQIKCSGAISSHDEKLLVIGPEGGFIDYEVEKLINAGCTPLQLGARIYRVENAIPLALMAIHPHF